MWPFRKREKKKRRAVDSIVVGLVIGGAIGSIIGKKMMEKHGCDVGDDDEMKNVK